MSYVDWKIKTKRLSACSCDYGCPCEFNGLPTHDYCRGVEALEITEGYFGDVRLDGLRVAGIFYWPGPVHEGGGSYQVVIDDRATQEQIDALFVIFSGEEQEPTTAFSIYASTIEHDLEPIFAPIDFAWNLDDRLGRAEVDGVLSLTFEPIRNPITGDMHRAIIKLPEGFEFREAEMASSNFWSTGPITQTHEKSYAFITYVTYGPYGVIEEESHPVHRA